jgi:RimJ/RimL family protein N-acetyltransferase
VIELRPVELGDLAAYIRMRTDPQMMAELGGPVPAEGLAEKLARDVAAAVADHSWTLMILPDPDDRAVVAGTVALWSHEDPEGGEVSEIGWMVLPEFQGRGLATTAVATVRQRAADDGRWGLVHAYPAVSNVPSNRLCRRTGFVLEGEHDKLFRGELFRTNHWVLDPARSS